MTMGLKPSQHIIFGLLRHSHNLPAQPCMPQATVVRTRIASPAIQEASNAGGRHAVRKLRGHTMADVVDLAALDALHAAGQFDQVFVDCDFGRASPEMFSISGLGRLHQMHPGEQPECGVSY